jgi:acyl-CoA synthetase (AMP-forming)/AMP-acid ligase II
LKVRLPEQLLATAETPRDLLQAVRDARPARALVSPPEVRPVMPVEAQAAPLRASTLVDVLDWHVRVHPQRLHIYLYGEAEQVEEITYSALHQGATAVAAGLQEHGLQPGQTAALMLPTSRSFFESFYGILLAGGIPVPLYPPMRRSQLADHLRRHVYELCLWKIDDRDLEGLDLSSWRLTFNGAESVSPETVRRFGERFVKYGFRPEAMMPVYGLAETSLALTCPPPGRGPRVDRIKREPFMRTGQAVPAHFGFGVMIRRVKNIQRTNRRGTPTIRIHAAEG